MNMSMYSMWTKDKIFIIGSFLASVHRECKRELACVQNALDKQMETEPSRLVNRFPSFC